jgi:hypothetical protein
MEEDGLANTDFILRIVNQKCPVANRAQKEVIANTIMFFVRQQNRK